MPNDRTPLKVLLIEDDPSHAQLFREVFADPDQTEVSVVWVQTLAEGLRRISTMRFDVAVVDLMLPDAQDLAIVRACLDAVPHVPLVVWTGATDIEMGRKAVKEGAQDYLVKGESSPDGIRRAIGQAIARHEDKRRIELLADRLAQRNEALRTFVEMAGHDLREPLRSIRSHLQLLIERSGDDLDDKAKGYVRYAVEASARMGDLLSAMLRFATSNIGDHPDEEVDLVAVMEKAQANLSEVIQETKAVIEVRALPKVRGDPDLLVELFMNLLGNALKFKRVDTPPYVVIRSEARAEGHEILVVDNGIGIAKGRHLQVFEPFVRLHGDRSHRGIGMGLAIAKRIVQLYGGTITAETNPEGGATFRIVLPIERPPDDETLIRSPARLADAN